MTPLEIRERLLSLADPGYRAFQCKLMPGTDTERVIGVRTPILRALAKELKNDPEIEDFLNDLPHRYYDENNLHGFIISECKDYVQTIAYVDALLPYVDNWATCDLLNPKCFRKNRDKLPADIERWLSSAHNYTVRFGIEMVMSHYLDGDFREDYLAKIAVIVSDDYYINMMIAWYFATALTKQWDSTIAYLEDKRLPVWVHNKTIRKAIESYCISDERKKYLRLLQIK